MDKEMMRISYNRLLNSTELKQNSVHLSKRKYLQLIESIKRFKSNPTMRKSPRDYWLLKRFDVIKVQNVEKLIVPMKKGDLKILYYIALEDLFDVIYEAHVAINHGGRDRTHRQLNALYKNLTVSDVKCFLEICTVCQEKKADISRFGTPKIYEVHSLQVIIGCYC